MQKVNHVEILEYTYETEEERIQHVSQMIEEGWRETGRQRRMKENAHIMTATDDDYEWYAEFRKNQN